MTENTRSEKFHKVLLGFAFAVSAVTGVVTFTESEVQHVIRSTKEMIAEVKKPEFANGMTEKQRKELEAQQRAFHDLSKAEAFRNKLTQPQLDEIDSLTAQLPWNSVYQSHFPSYGVVSSYEYVGKSAVKLHNPNAPDPKPHEPKPIIHLDPKMPPQNVTMREVTIHEITTREVTTHEITTHENTAHENTTHESTTAGASPSDPKPAAKQVEPASDDSSKDH